MLVFEPQRPQRGLRSQPKDFFNHRDTEAPRFRIVAVPRGPRKMQKRKTRGKWLIDHDPQSKGFSFLHFSRIPFAAGERHDGNNSERSLALCKPLCLRVSVVRNRTIERKKHFKTRWSLWFLWFINQLSLKSGRREAVSPRYWWRICS